MLFSGCQNNVLPTLRPQTIEETIMSSLQSPDSGIIIDDFKLLSIDNMKEGEIVIYRFISQNNTENNPNPVDTHNIGLAFIKEVNNNLTIDTSKNSGSNHIPQKIIYDSVNVGSEFIVFGQVIDSNAIFVSATYSDGSIITKQITNQTFFLDAPRGVEIQELRVLDVHKNIINTYKAMKLSS